MFTKRRKAGLFFVLAVMLVCVTACGNIKTDGLDDTQNTSQTEKEIEIIDATDILSTIWEKYDAGFDIMGGHFTSPFMDMPAKYDLSQVQDLQLMYCVPTMAGTLIDDASTMIHLYNASEFTAGAYHVADVKNVQTLVDEIKNQVASNQWHSDTPEKLFIVEVKEQYVVVVFGTEQYVNSFKTLLMNVYEKVSIIAVEELL